MLLAKGVLGAVLLFLGQELHFLFAAAMAALIGLRLTPLLPPQWPGLYDYVFVGILALIAAAIPLIHERVGYFVSGFLAGGYFLVEYYAPGVLTLPLFPFIFGGVIGSLIIGLFTHWGLMMVSCLIGVYFVTNLFTLSSTAKILVSAGLFVIGALTQVIIWRMQKDD
ncbi:MAG: hypothetical protein EHM33_08155 [Chloroflexi bacterium]|nr:MAG: hypothetical protein EHM33_08155 [Chloroflexota bacterium]